VRHHLGPEDLGHRPDQTGQRGIDGHRRLTRRRTRGSRRLAGDSRFEQQNAQIIRRIAKLYEGLKEPVLRRHGETDGKTEELI
jgi:hypothetical protein